MQQLDLFSAGEPDTSAIADQAARHAEMRRRSAAGLCQACGQPIDPEWLLLSFGWHCRASEAAQGRAWCGGCDSSQPILGRDKRRARCAECERARERSRKRSRAKKRPAAVLPPLSPIAQQMVRAWVALVDEAWVSSFE